MPIPISKIHLPTPVFARSCAGFTLIELLIVMAILGILSVIGIGSFTTARIKAVDARRKSDLESIAKSLEAYVNDYQSYPTDDAGRIDCGASACEWGRAFTVSGTTYAARLPQDPGGYLYVYSSSGTDFTLYAYLQNTEDPAIVETGISEYCNTSNTTRCNYKITSSNL